ncbi:MAG: hypothetical protein HEEMFOPI_00853 [Holosporales bacterium]
MKKLAIVAVIATSAAVAAPFNGLSVGGSLGLGFVKNKATFSTASAATAASFSAQDTTNSQTNLLVRVFAGYTKTFGNMIAGVDAGLGYERMNGWISGSSADVSKDVNNWSVSVDPRVGYKFNETSAIYAKLRIAYNTYGIDGSSWLLNTNQISKNNWSYTPSLGFEKFVSSNASIRTEIGYEVSKFKLANNSALSKASKNGVVASVGYAYTF